VGFDFGSRVAAYSSRRSVAFSHLHHHDDNQPTCALPSANNRSEDTGAWLQTVADAIHRHVRCMLSKDEQGTLCSSRYYFYARHPPVEQDILHKLQELLVELLVLVRLHLLRIYDAHVHARLHTQWARISFLRELS